jgi:hypothetical protein
MGVILSVGLRCRPQYRVEEHMRIVGDCEDVLAAEEAYPLQQFFLVPFLWKYLTQHRREVATRRSFLAPLYGLYWFLGIDLGLHLVLKTLISVLRSRLLLRFFYRQIVPLTILRGWRVTDTSANILTMEHELFRHIEIEIFVKRSKLVDTLRFVRRLLEYCDGRSDAVDDETWSCLEERGVANSVREMLGNYTHHYPICVRTVLPDATLISMASSDDEPYYALSFISYSRCQERDSFFRFANLLAETSAILFNARPHWGKVCPISSQTAEQLYPKLPEFRQMCDALDTGKVFRNQWLKDVIFQGSSAVEWHDADSPLSPKK